MWTLGAIISASDVRRADLESIASIARGDRLALAALYDRHSRLVYSLAFRILRDTGDAEEVVQDVFTQVWRQSARYDPSRGNLAAWLATLTRSRAIDRLRRRHARPDAIGEPVDAGSVVDPAERADDQLLSSSRAATVRAAMDELPFVQRTAIELAFFEGLTYVEVAQRLETPIGTIKTRIRQGLLTLRDRLAEAI